VVCSSLQQVTAVHQQQKRGMVSLEQLVSLDDIQDTKRLFLSESISKVDSDNFLRTAIQDSLP
jgi:hypothetical protein